jgi:hypothetical protein
VCMKASQFVCLENMSLVCVYVHICMYIYIYVCVNIYTYKVVRRGAGRKCIWWHAFQATAQVRSCHTWCVCVCVCTYESSMVAVWLCMYVHVRANTCIRSWCTDSVFYLNDLMHTKSQPEPAAVIFTHRYLRTHTHYLCAGSLFDLIHTKPQLKPEAVIVIGCGVCKGMTYLHSMGIIHRFV